MNGPAGTRLVVAGVFVRAGRLLMSRRPAGGAWPGLWELPGGKVEDGETPEEALAREWKEELDAIPVGLSPFHFSTTAGVGPEEFSRHITLLFFEVIGVAGEPRAVAVDAVRWCTVAEAKLLPMPPADAPALGRLLEKAGGDVFEDTESEKGRDLVRALASRSPFIENSESLSSIRALAFRKPRPNGDGVVSGLLVATPDGARAYRNVCPHVSIPLDRGGEPLLTADGLFLVCRNHGALFNPEDGFCVAGPCEGESLVPLPVIRNGVGWALDDGPAR
ncbi:MAG: NUDIX domain-containing protein [Acidobacteriota bacterium]|nr:NUDIX domain-containing protein [Acidobacteriota bacterium]